MAAMALHEPIGSVLTHWGPGPGGGRRVSPPGSGSNGWNRDSLKHPAWRSPAVFAMEPAAQARKRR